MRGFGALLFGGLLGLALSGCQGGSTAWLPLAEEREEILRLSLEEPPPQERWPQAPPAERLADGVVFTLWDEQGVWSEDALPGAYTIADEALLYLRPADSAAGHAHSMVGMPVVPADSGHHRAQLATSGEGYDPLSLMIHSWRLADDFPWPWVDNLGTFGGLASYLRRRSPASGLHFAPDHGYYVDDQGKPVRIGGDPAGSGVQLALGDVISAEQGQEVATMTILVADRGIPGYLDPEDVVVTAQDLGGAAAWQVRQDRLGLTMGQRPLHAFRRDRERAEEHLAQRLQGSNPVWTMEPHQVWMLVVGVVILSVTLLRWGRLRRRAQASSQLPPRRRDGEDQAP